MPKRTKDFVQQHVPVANDPITINTTMQKHIVDAPILFRGRGIHPRDPDTAPGTASKKFAKSNTNIPLWPKDMATAPADQVKQRQSKDADSRENALHSQKFAARQTICQAQQNTRFGNFFIDSKRQQEQQQQKPARPMTAATPSTANTASNIVAATSPAPSVKQQPSVPAGANLKRQFEVVHQSKGRNPATQQREGSSSTSTGNSLKGFVPTEEASSHRPFGKAKPQADCKLNKANASPEVVFKGKKNFHNDAALVSEGTSATQIGSPKREARVVQSAQLAQSSRFSTSQRHVSNLTSDNKVADKATSREFDYGGGGAKSGRKQPEQGTKGAPNKPSLQHVFQAPPKKIDSAYRPVAPFAMGEDK